MRFWRISNYADLTGTGAKKFAGRWNSGGSPMVYLSDHPSSALLETIVHIDREYLPANFQLLCIEAPDSLPVDAVNLPDGWQDEPAETQAIGEWFLKKRIAPLLRVPSVIMPQALNFLLNPNHPDSSKVQIAQIWRYPFNSRLLM